MTIADRWLLPEGIEEILPNRAIKIERLRRRLLDLCHLWGYDLVIPPLAEFTESLLSGSGADLDLMTFKVTDQLSGRTLGVRADITPQVARMDAHSLYRKGPSRLCYTGHVLYTRPKTALETRSPFQLGVELFGEEGLEADIEVITLLVETLRLAGLGKIHLDLGHVAIYRELELAANLDDEGRRKLCALLQAKDASLPAWLDKHIGDGKLRAMLAALPSLTGDKGVLERAAKALQGAPQPVFKALEELDNLIQVLARRVPEVEIFLDLGELHGYHYHTGLVFAAYAPESVIALGNGGRYDHVGEAFGRARPATGFGVDLGLIATLVEQEEEIVPGIYVPALGSGAIEGEIARLRRAGERVVCGFRGQRPDFEELHCDRVLVATDNDVKVIAALDYGDRAGSE